MPNLTAYLALFLWPLVAVVLFRTQPPERAVVWTILGGYLFLPVRPVFDFPMIPAIDKAAIASFVALIGALFLRRSWLQQEALVPLARTGMPALRDVSHTRFLAPQAAVQHEEEMLPTRSAEARRETQPVMERLLPKGGLVVLCLVAAAGVIATTLSNSEPIPAGPFSLPGMQAYDMGSVLLALGIMLIPFLLGWRFLNRSSGQRAILVAFAIGGMLYAPLMLIEVRLSPQLNNWIYGFFPHSWVQHVRNGGFRPIVFLSHGLWVGIFMAMAILSSLALWRLTPTGFRPFFRLRWLALAGGLLVVLVLAKALGALMIALVLSVVVLFGGRRLVMLVAAGTATLVLFYPMARGAGLVPVDAVLSFAESISPERAQSFHFRLRNEDLLLAKANEKALFGWGTWGRGFIYDDWGNRTSVTDGSWIIVMNGFGLVGYVAQFGLLCLPLIRMALRSEIGPEAVFLAAVLAANLLDLIPNATLEPITWLVAGAVAGTIFPKAARNGQVATRRSAGQTARRRVDGVASQRISRT